jgi:hypothetical protein
MSKQVQIGAGSGVRPFAEGDLTAVAAMWLRAFRREGDPGEVARYFREVFLEGPGGGEGVRSLVHEDGRGGIGGFVGALPRAMLFEGRPLRAAVATQLMVDPGPRRAFVAFDLLRALFAGPQELTFSDGSNDASRAVWERTGGEVALLHCLEWTRVLRPAGYMQHRLARRLGGPGALAGRPLCNAVDEIAALLPVGALRPPRAALQEEELSAEAVLALLRRGAYALRPAYDAPPLAWLLRKAAETRGHGALRQRLCRDAQGAPAGWYVYYAKPGGVSKVLQLGGIQRAIAGVLGNLFADAFQQGSVAISGQAEPRFLRELSEAHARFACNGLGVVVHSRRQEVLAAIHRGDAFLSRLDGEWWLRFAADPLGAAPASRRAALGGDRAISRRAGPPSRRAIAGSALRGYSTSRPSWGRR